MPSSVWASRCDGSAGGDPSRPTRTVGLPLAAPRKVDNCPSTASSWRLLTSSTGSTTSGLYDDLVASPLPVLERELDRAMSATASVALSRWASSGAMWLTGHSDREPIAAPARSALVLDALAEEIAALTEGHVDLDGAALLGERAAIAGLGRQGRLSCGGHSRTLRGADGWLALSLARDDDLAALDAWLGTPIGLGGPVPVTDWTPLERVVAAHPVATLVGRARLLGIPCAAVGEVDRQTIATLPVIGRHELGRRCPEELTVVDLSSLWAGPLCANLLGLAGARVIKVESVNRPDGARFGPPAFFDLLHGGHESVALDFNSGSDRIWLRRLIDRADVVIEASRPRALRALGVSFDDCVVDGWRGVWLSLTAHQLSTSDALGRVGFGDDTAAAGGLVVWDEGTPLFCADAIADPLCGAMAAVACLRAVYAGVGGRYALSLSGAASVVARGIDRHGVCNDSAATVELPRARPIVQEAAPLGAHTDAVLGEC